jgi:hypothetical protein
VNAIYHLRCNWATVRLKVRLEAKPEHLWVCPVCNDGDPWTKLNYRIKGDNISNSSKGRQLLHMSEEGRLICDVIDVYSSKICQCPYDCDALCMYYHC